MENPNTWTKDTHAIQAAIDRHNKQVSEGAFGHSLAVIIEDDVIKPLRREYEEMIVKTISLMNENVRLEKQYAAEEARWQAVQGEDYGSY